MGALRFINGFHAVACMSMLLAMVEGKSLTDTNRELSEGRIVYDGSEVLEHDAGTTGGVRYASECRDVVIEDGCIVGCNPGANNECTNFVLTCDNERCAPSAYLNDGKCDAQDGLQYDKSKGTYGTDLTCYSEEKPDCDDEIDDEETTSVKDTVHYNRDVSICKLYGSREEEDESGDEDEDGLRVFNPFAIFCVLFIGASTCPIPGYIVISWVEVGIFAAVMLPIILVLTYLTYDLLRIRKSKPSPKPTNANDNKSKFSKNDAQLQDPTSYGVERKEVAHV